MKIIWIFLFVAPFIRQAFDFLSDVLSMSQLELFDIETVCNQMTYAKLNIRSRTVSPFNCVNK